MRVLCALAVVCLLVRVELSSAQQCPADFRLVNNMCYKFSTSNAPRDQAVSVCAAMGARLLAVRDATQQQAVENLLSFEQAGWDYTWTSLKEAKTIWRWSFNDAPVESFTSDCFTRASGSNLFELTYLKDTSFTPPSCENACKNWLGDTFRTSAVTVINCKNEGAACLNGLQAACFCGNSDVPNPEPATCNSPCPQDTGLICGASDSYYRNVAVNNGWAPNEPKTTDGNELCMAIGYGNSFQWIAKPCSTLMRYACKFEYLNTEDTCTRNGNAWFAETNLCFKISTEAYNWFDAQTQCKAENGILIQPLASQNFRVQVSTMVKPYNGNKLNVVWDTWTAATSTELKWGDGTPLAFNKFAESRPDITRGNCIAISKQSTPQQYLWDSRSCQESQPFICEMAASIAPTPTTTTTTTTTTTPAPTTTTTTATTTLSTASTTPTPAPTPAPTAATPAPTPATPAPTPATPAPTPATAAPTPAPGTPAPGTPATPRPSTRQPSVPAITPTPSRPSTRGVTTGIPTTPSIFGTTTNKDKTGGGQNTLENVAGVLGQLTLGTKIVIGIVAFVVVISIILMIVFICQRRRKESYDDNWNE